ncbi:MAG: hypothetical protein ACTHJR_18355 [Sphingomonas sp.]|uniref:hypothetical protein n=1 Tax=Sphingomonas sp. TaxID=28214 RepID=UPI003F814021
MAACDARRAPPTRAAVFVVTSDRCPHVLCRLLGLFAQQDRMVERVEAIDTRRTLRVRVQVADIDRQRAAIVAEKMRQLVMVRTVELRSAGDVAELAV